MEILSENGNVLQIELTDEEERIFLKHGLSVLAKEKDIKVKIIDREKLEALGFEQDIKTYELSDAEIEELINISINDILLRYIEKIEENKTLDEER